ncbi:hypothetical protein AB0N33_00705 [Pseudarthrobacter oxydans]|uniref:hypothetical protein n=1 Tax=Pseudarthrobacter oxydans TaxID=1671 RepID=UPI00343D9CC6
MNELRAANVFGLTGIRPKDGGTDLDGFVNVNGPLTVNGTQVVNGPMTITGTLSLPAGIIGNDALTDPLVISTSGVSQNNFATSTGATAYASATVTIPDGYSRADVQCMVVGGAINSTATGDYLYVASSINGVAGGETPQAAAASGGYASAAANGIRSLTGLAGGTITVACQIRSGGAAWTASTSNFANMNAVIFFRR